MKRGDSLAVQFSLDRFYRINRRALIWLALFGLIYILRDFFALIFLTFLIVSFTLPLINYLKRETRVPRKVIIVAVYLFIFIGVLGLIRYVVPIVINEARLVGDELVSLREKVDVARYDIVKEYPNLKPAVDVIEKLDFNWEAKVADFKGHAQYYITATLGMAFTAVSTLFLSLLFAFLIILDLTRLREEVRKLGRSRLHDFYEQSAEPVVRFAAVIARSFRAQAMIAVVNTVLTAVGFMLLGLPKIALLSIVVFFFSFIPVLGVFVSTVPAVLVALNAGGWVLGVKVVAFVVIIHMVEAYVLNPLIYGQHLKLNPVVVLIILYVGHHFFGVWGMLLGVPVAYYFIHYVFQVPEEPVKVPLSEPEPGSRSGLFRRRRTAVPTTTQPDAAEANAPPAQAPESPEVS
jgi:predicted PurR-regulated permease PerM